MCGAAMAERVVDVPGPEGDVHVSSEFCHGLGAPSDRVPHNEAGVLVKLVRVGSVGARIDWATLSLFLVQRNGPARPESSRCRGKRGSLGCPFVKRRAGPPMVTCCGHHEEQS